MLRKTICLGLAGLTLCVALLPGAEQARAQGAAPQYGAFRVQNNTDQPITYQVQWYVNGVAQGWVTYTVQPQTWDAQYVQWNPGQMFPGAEWRYYDYTKGAWSAVSHPAACITTDPKNGGFLNSFALANGSLYVSTGS
jgi:hypothetical protein